MNDKGEYKHTDFVASKNLRKPQPPHARKFACPPHTHTQRHRTLGYGPPHLCLNPSPLMRSCPSLLLIFLKISPAPNSDNICSPYYKQWNLDYCLKSCLCIDSIVIYFNFDRHFLEKTNWICSACSIYCSYSVIIHNSPLDRTFQRLCTERNTICNKFTYNLWITEVNILQL
jgi:hypothetical protein